MTLVHLLLQEELRGEGSMDRMYILVCQINFFFHFFVALEMENYVNAYFSFQTAIVRSLLSELNRLKIGEYKEGRKILTLVRRAQNSQVFGELYAFILLCSHPYTYTSETKTLAQRRSWIVGWCAHNYTHQMIRYDLVGSTEYGIFDSTFYMDIFTLCAFLSFGEFFFFFC